MSTQSVTVLRGVAGFGPDGKPHAASLVDLPLVLPLIVEFYDEVQRVDLVLGKLTQQIPLRHELTWPASHRVP